MGSSLYLRFGQACYKALGIDCDSNYKRRPDAFVLGSSEGNAAICKAVNSREGCMISRLGTSEACASLNYLEIYANSGASRCKRAHHLLKGNRERWDYPLIQKLANNAGVFPATEEIAEAFSKRVLSDLQIMDFAGVWGIVPGEGFLLDRFCPKSVRFEASALEPYYFKDPWSANLEGKRVLVVHPFADTINQQYNRNRQSIFPKTRVLPHFELSTVRAVQSLGGTCSGFNTWIEALEWMESEIGERDFDIALIGAGGYGLPLAAHVKRLGKIAIHMGGSLQILFGIKGKRWDNMSAISRFYNEHWVRPSDSERPEGAHKVESGCYW